jgi:hypothetical protein
VTIIIGFKHVEAADCKLFICSRLFWNIVSSFSPSTDSVSILDGASGKAPLSANSTLPKEPEPLRVPNNSTTYQVWWKIPDANRKVSGIEQRNGAHACV